MSPCLSSFAMDDRALHGPADAAVDRHLGECRRCRARFEERARVVADFETGGLAARSWARVAVAGRASATGPRPLALARERWRWLRLSGMLVGAVSGAAAMVVAVRGLDHGHSTAPATLGYSAPKGGGVPVEVLCRRGDRTFVVAPDDSVAPGDRLRFRPRPTRSGAAFIQIGSVDGRGTYAPFYPAHDGVQSVPLPPAGQALEGAIALDAAPGPERLFVVLSSRPLSVSDVRRAALDAAPRLANPADIGGLPVSTAWIALRKEAPPAEPAAVAPPPP